MIRRRRRTATVKPRCRHCHDVVEVFGDLCDHCRCPYLSSDGHRSQVAA